jgi:hypothetical protein
MNQATCWKVEVWVAVTNFKWTRLFAFKPTMDNVLASLYLEWNMADEGSDRAQSLRTFVTVVDYVRPGFSDDSGRKFVVKIDGAQVGWVSMKKERMYTR